MSVKDIRSIDFSALKRKGITGIVIDRDNCLTLPRQDYVVSELQNSWIECKEAFGSDGCVILSNSAGTGKDPGLIQAKVLSRNTGVHVVEHNHPKPSSKLRAPLENKFGDLKNVAFVGDRLLTDVYMGNSFGGVSIHTQQMWGADSRGEAFGRWLEHWLAKRVTADNNGYLDCIRVTVMDN
ncbi:hypothetical protein E3P86_00447 [Wallemia ichthyophaga]|uniref:Phosphatidylglycerophosphatase GEP4, mitochondrial n=1 Tax=Wallemia ichthyophaga TaxID=245174 RepID=A0A4T0JH31_WALIC|nr:hypothetical protein E3P86_00447 [Wallemia ichthyophaga]